MIKLLLILSLNTYEFILPSPPPARFEARSRRGKGNKKRRRGGNGLR